MRVYSRGFFHKFGPRTQSLYVLHWDAIILSSSINNDDDDGGDDYDGDDDGDGEGDGEEKIPQVYIYKLPINRPSGRILIGVILLLLIGLKLKGFLKV